MLCRALFALLFVVALPALAAETDPGLQSAVDSPARSAANRARDGARHPLAALEFFGVKPDSVVVEIEPGGAEHWTEILAPYLSAKGRYVAALPAAISDEARRGNAAFAAKVAADPSAYGRVATTTFGPDATLAPAGSVDFVLSFRNLHNWLAHGEAEPILKSFYAALKPGGVLGIVDHRAADSAPQDPIAKSGYVRQDYAIKLIESVGFKFAGASELNANPKDTKDYSVGVWALPPTFRLKDVDRAKYEAIGESDRFTLKFVKP